MNDIVKNNTEVMQTLSSLDICPYKVEEDYVANANSKIPFSNIASLGVAFEPISQAFQSIFTSSGGSGLYRVTVPNGGHLAMFNNGKGYLGSVLSNSSNAISAQATLNPIALNPTMLFMAVALYGIEKKLDKLEETQQEILDYLKLKDKSEMNGDIVFLSDVLNNYKYNWNNDKFLNNNHLKVLDIKQSSEQKMIFYKSQIVKIIKNKTLLHSDITVEKQIDKVQDLFKDYQMAMYLYSFSCFLDVMLLGNYEFDFIKDVIKKMEGYSFEYRELYTDSYNKLSDYSDTSIQSHLLNGIASVTKFAGQTIEKVPVISNSQIDETLIKTGDKINVFNSKQTTKSLEKLLDKQNNYIYPFVENLKTVQKLYNNDLNIVFDKDNLYFSSERA